MLNSSAYKLLFNLLKEKPVYILASTILSISSAVLNVISTILLIPILFISLGSTQSNILAYQPDIIRYLFSFFNSFPETQKLAIVIASFLSVIILKNCIIYTNTIINIKQSQRLAARIRNQGFNIISQVELNYFQRNKVGDILFKLNRETDKAVLNIKSCQKLVVLSLTILVFVFFLILISWQLTLICFLLFWATNKVKVTFILITKNLQSSSSQKTKLYARKVVDFVTGIRLIKIAGNEREEQLAINQIMQEKNKAQLKNKAVLGLINPATEIAGSMIIIFLIILACYLYQQPLQYLSLILLTYLIILFRLLPFISQINNARSQFIHTKNSMEKITAFLEQDNHHIIESGVISFAKLSSGIEFSNVTFAYPNHAQIILDKINLSISQGENIALVGISGAGKSIITELLPRFYEPIDGQILIDGKNIQEYDLSSLRKSITIINNKTFLFNNSLAYNLIYGLPKVNESDVLVAIKKVDLEQFVNQLPQGLATEIGPQGVILSEEQKQKIAIARAILRDPEILILDESSIAADVLAEPEVQDAIAELCCGRTALIIANQLSTVKNADRVIVFNKGVVIESGTHAELLHQGDFYNRWYSMQFKTSQQSHQQKLAQKIAKKLARQTHGQLSAEIRQNLDELLSYMHLINEDSFKDELEQEKILDESYQSAKDMLASLREYERKIARGFDNTDIDI